MPRARHRTMSWSVTLFLLITSQLFVLPTLADEFFADSKQAVKGRVLSVQSGCFAAGKHKQLLVAHRQGTYPTYSVHLSLFQAAGEKWQRGPEVPIAADAVGFDIVGSCEDNKRQQLAVFYSNHLELTNPVVKGSSKKVAYDILLYSQDLGNLPYLNFIRDFDGDGTPDMLYPTFDSKQGSGIALLQNVFSAKPKRFFYPKSLKNFVRKMQPNEPLSFHFESRQSTFLPEIVNCDFDGDGRRDICLLWQDEVGLIRLGDDGLYANQLSWRYFDILNEKDRIRPGSYAVTFVGSMGEDKVADIVVNRLAGTVTDPDTTTTIFNRDLTRESKKVLRGGEEKSSGALLIDINNDGYDDLVQATAPSGLVAAVKVLLRKTIKVRFLFFLADSKGKISDKPDFTRDISFKVNTKTFRPHGFLPTLSGDFDGDGLPDALYGKSDNKLHLILQDRGTLFPNRITYKGEFKVSSQFLMDDLNGDQKSDLVFWYREWFEQSNFLVLVNRGVFRSLKQRPSAEENE